jgi:uncharacterized protein (TIGR02246 family)
MDRRALLAGATGASLAGATAAWSEPQAHADEAAEVRHIVDEIVASWNTADAERMYRLATDDIEWVNIMGMYWRGKAQVQAAHHAILTTRYKGVGEALEEIESVRPVGADAVLAVVRKRIDAFTAPDGAAIPSTQNRLTLVFRRTPDGLRLAHGANVEVNPRAARSNPAPPSPSLR